MIRCLVVVLLFFVSCSGGSKPKPPVPIPPPTPNICPVLVDLPPRGHACLHCTQPQAGASFEAIVSMLEKSCLKRPAINFLVDGSFGFDEARLKSAADRLCTNGRECRIEFYLTNGASMKSWKTTKLDGFGVKDGPEVFNRKIQNDPAYQGRFKALVSRLNPVIEHALAKGAQVFVTGGLEDQNSDSAFNALYGLARSATPFADRVKWCRNPSGGGRTRPPGVCLEDHVRNANFDVRNGIASNDGDDYTLPGEQTSYARSQPLQNWKNPMLRAGGFDTIWILWDAEAQGYRGSPPAAADRNYRVLNQGQQDQIINFLKQ